MKHNNNGLQMEIEFTKTYKKYSGDNAAIREAMCISSLYPGMLCDLNISDTYAGWTEYGAIGFSSQQAGFMYFLKEEKIFEEIQKPNPDKGYKEELIGLLDFWRNENSYIKLRSIYPPEMSKALPSDNWSTEPGIGFPLYRIAGACVNFDKLMHTGIPGLYKEVRGKKVNAPGNEEKKLYEAMEIALDNLVKVALYYAEQAKELAARPECGGTSKNPAEIARILTKLTVSPPDTLREAIQLTWLYLLVSEVRNYGRMDVYLGDFLAHDLDMGLITEEEAFHLIKEFWVLLARRKFIYDGRIIIGGLGRRNERNADRFALLAIEATRTVREAEPQLSLRCYKGMDASLLDKALEVIGEGRTFPILYNDDVNVPSVMKAFEVTESEAVQYMPFGCGEYVLDHMSFGTPSGVINLLKALEVTLHNGVDPTTGKSMGLQTGSTAGFDTFDKLFDAYGKQIEYYVETLAKQEELEYEFAGENAAFLYLGMLYDDCIEKGKAIFSGGIRYLGGTLEAYGNTNTADSLAAINEIVYRNKLYSLDEIVAALDKDFMGHEAIRRMMLDAPKYGNDDSAADNMAAMVHNHICGVIRNQRNNTSLHSYLAVIINNQANTILGRYAGASADGRKCGAPMANANAPSGGSDKKGITALLNSLVKLDTSIHAGAVQNLKFSRKMFIESKPMLSALLNTYFDNGGAQCMITVSDRGVLEKAMAEPENYKDVFVRVGGFSARFVELDKDVQLEVLSRTMY